MKTKQSLWTRANRALKFGLASIVAAASIAPTTGCSMSEFNPLFKPSPISSTEKERGLFDFGAQIEKLHNSKEPYTLNGDSDTLYVRAENFYDTLKEFGVKNNGTFNELFETNRVQIKYRNPKTGELVDETQIIPNDGTIDTLELGSFNAFGARQKLDDAITKAARTKFGDETLEVAVQQVAYPFAEGPTIYLGQAYISTPAGGMIVHIGDQPLDVQAAAIAGPTADTKYLALIKKITNLDDLDKAGNPFDSNGDGRVVTKDHPDFVRRVIVYGTTGGFVSAAYEDINFSNEDRLVGVGNKPLDNAIAANHKVGDYMDSVLHMTSGYVLGRGDVDFMTHETAYLAGHLADNGKPNKVQKITGRISDVDAAFKSVKDLGCTLGGKCDTGAK